MTDPAVERRGGGTPLRRRMGPRDRDETDRAATPLELLFDLCFVVAVAQAPTACTTPCSRAAPPAR